MAVYGSDAKGFILAFSGSRLALAVQDIFWYKEVGRCNFQRGIKPFAGTQVFSTSAEYWYSEAWCIF